MRRTTVLSAATAAALAAGSLAVTGVLGSSHREAPKILADPTADNTDVYAFTAPDAPHSLTVVANWIPMEEPAGGRTSASSIRGPATTSRSTTPATAARTSRTGGSSSSASATRSRSWTRRRPSTRSTTRTSTSSRPTTSTRRPTASATAVSTKRIAHDVPVAPANTGPKTVPDYAKVAAGAISALPGGGKTFVGPADDPFFVDLDTVFDGMNIDKPGRPNIGLGNQGGGKDDVSGYNTHAFVLQVPGVRRSRATARPVADAKSGNAVVGVWASTERRRVSVRRGKHHGRPWVQVSRLGNPLINEVVIPIGQKDKFNRTSPANDAKNFGKYALNPEVARLLNALFKLERQGDQPHGHRPGAPDRRPRPHPDR